MINQILFGDTNAKAEEGDYVQIKDGSIHQVVANENDDLVLEDMDHMKLLTDELTFLAAIGLAVPGNSFLRDVITPIVDDITRTTDDDDDDNDDSFGSTGGGFGGFGGGSFGGGGATGAF